MGRPSSLTIVGMAFDDDLKKARDLAQDLKDALGVKDFSAKTETLQEMETGSPRTPGYDEHSGKTMKAAPKDPTEPEPPVTPTPAAAAQVEVSEPTNAQSKSTDFDKWLAAAQGQEQKQSHEQDRTKDIDR